jgi:DNA invertase Pin-like site-specific DNA recombinase
VYRPRRSHFPTDSPKLGYTDLSRWGRFLNHDEGAHYELVCARAGIPLHYCAESFANDGTPSSSLRKALKRSMAAEFSREFRDKVFRGKSRLVQMGYWFGGQAGYGRVPHPPEFGLPLQRLRRESSGRSLVRNSESGRGVEAHFTQIANQVCRPAINVLLL